MKRLSLIVVGILFAPSAFAESASADAVSNCKAMYPLPTLSINFVQESTGHDPRQFLIRRCISNQRKKIMAQRQITRQQIRATSRYDRSAARTQAYKIKSENYLQDAIRRQNLKEQRFRSRTNQLDPEIFRDSRRSRREIVRQAEGLDRINAIRRNLRSKNLPDPCKTVGAIRQFNNPCRNYGSSRGSRR